jgi:UDP-glucose:(heptosyl)LPS alpha-1,3-glucosyltransferase
MVCYAGLLERMKIGLVRRGFNLTGGAESYLKRLGRILLDHGHTTTLYATYDWPSAEWQYGKLIRLKSRSPLGFAQELKQRVLSDDLLFSLERVLACDCYRAGDGVHQRWLERRARFEPRWRTRFRARSRKHTEILALERRMFHDSGAGFVIANSELVKQEIIATFNTPSDRIAVIHNGLPDPHFQKNPGSRADLRRALGLEDTDIGVLFAGSGWERKGLKFAIQALRRTRDRRLKLLVAGRGRKPVLPKRNIRFLGPVTDLESVYLASDLFILPTIYDPFSNACLEALSFGLPVITTSANGCSEIMTSGIHGQIIGEPDDLPALHEALEIWSDPDLRAKARKPCLELAALYTMERNMAETAKVIEKLCK